MSSKQVFREQTLVFRRVPQTVRHFAAAKRGLDVLHDFVRRGATDDDLCRALGQERKAKATSRAASVRLGQKRGGKGEQKSSETLGLLPLFSVYIYWVTVLFKKSFWKMLQHFLFFAKLRSARGPPGGPGPRGLGGLAHRRGSVLRHHDKLS